MTAKRLPNGHDVLARMNLAHVGQAGGAAMPTTRDLALFARVMMRMRLDRDGQFLPGLFQDPAWDIMLDLFVARADGHDLSISAVCVGCRAASATALRYLTLLQEAGLVERKPDPSDRRRSYVRLTADGHQRMKVAMIPSYERMRALFD